MVDGASFMKLFGIFFIGLALLSGFVFWIVTVIKKSCPNLKYKLKYNLLRRKYNVLDVEMLYEYLSDQKKGYEVKKDLLLNRNIPLKKVDELCYIYDEMMQKEVNKK